MKKWVVIDDCMSSKSSTYEEILDATTAEEAEAEARFKWDRMTEYDKKLRDAYYVGLCDITPEIEEGEVYYTDTMTDIINIK